MPKYTSFTVGNDSVFCWFNRFSYRKILVVSGENFKCVNPLIWKANKVFDENQKKSNVNLTQVLTSFKDQLESFGKRVNDIYNEETKQRVSLLTEIKNLNYIKNNNNYSKITKIYKSDIYNNKQYIV